MSSKISAKIVSLILPLLLAACCPSTRYAGDGTMVSETCWPFVWYKVAFTPLSTGVAQSRTYFIHALPEFDSVVGFKLTTPQPFYCEDFMKSPAARATVALRLTSNTGKEVANYRGALSDWTWEHGLPPNPPRPWEPDECFLYADSLHLRSAPLKDLTLQITVDLPGDPAISLTPMIKSSLSYSL